MNTYTNAQEKAIKKWAQIHLIKSARVHGAAISHLGDPSQLPTHLPSLTSLDLTCNLISTWSFVEGLSSSLTKLADLNLSDNKIELPLSVTNRPTLVNLTTLRLNYCGLSWNQVVAIEPSLPSLEVLHLCGNGIDSLGPSDLMEIQVEAREKVGVKGFNRLQVKTHKLSLAFKR